MAILTPEKYIIYIQISCREYILIILLLYTIKTEIKEK